MHYHTTNVTDSNKQEFGLSKNKNHNHQPERQTHSRCSVCPQETCTATFMGKTLEDDRVDMVGQGDQMWRWDAVDAVYGNSSFAYSTNSTLAARNVSNMTGVILSHPYYQHSVTVAASFIMAYLFIFLLCMVGNGLVCLIVLRNRCMRTVTNLFIFNLAISDLLVGVFCIPTTLVDNLITGNGCDAMTYSGRRWTW